MCFVLLIEGYEEHVSSEEISVKGNINRSFLTLF